MTQKTCVEVHVYDFYFKVTFCNLTFLSMDFVLMYAFPFPFRTHSQALASTLSAFELFAAHLTSSRAQNVKAQHFDLRPDLDLTRDRNIKKLTMY